MKYGLKKRIIIENKWICCWGTLFSLFFCFFIAIMPIVSQYLIDDVLNASQKSNVYFGIIVFLCVCLMQPLLFYIKESIFIHLCEKISLNLRKKAFFKMSKLPLEFYENHDFGELSIKIMSDTREVSSYIYVLFSNYITSIIAIVTMFVAMIYESILLSLVIILISLVYISFCFIYTKKIKPLTKESIALSEQMQGVIKQRFDNAMLTKIYLIDKINEDKSNKIIDSMRINNLKIRRTSNVISTFGMSLTSIALCIIYGVGALLIIDGKMTLGIVIAMGLFYQSITPLINNIVSSNVSYNRVKPSFARMESLFEQEEEAGTLDIGKELSIEFSNVCFKYNSNVQVLKDFNLSIRKSGYYGILGCSGVGKSTIAKLLLGLYKFESGEIKIFGENINVIDKRKLRLNVSYVSQNLEFLNDSICNNLRLANSEITIEDIISICKKLKIHDKICELKDDYYTVLSEKINLSGGEQRRLAIARGILKKSLIYIFDEPDAYLDDEFISVLDGIFKELSKNAIVLVISHNKEMFINVDEIIKI